MKKRVLFLCTHNSARSQMAEGLANFFLGDLIRAESAGIVETFVKKPAIDVMAEIGIDITMQKSKSMDKFLDEEFDFVVTVCDNARESCPFFPGMRVIHRDFNDPSDTKGSQADILGAFRNTRDEIKSWLLNDFRGILDDL